MVRLRSLAACAIGLITCASTLVLAQSTVTPGAPRAQAPAQQETAIDGTIDVYIEDWADGARVRHVLNAGGRRIPLQLRTTSRRLTSGERVRVRGTRLASDGLAVTSIESFAAGQQATTIVPHTFGQQSALFVLVNFRDNPGYHPFSPSTVQDVVDQTEDYFSATSFNQAWLASDVSPWITIDHPSDAPCDWSRIATLADQGVGPSINQYQRVIYVFPFTKCGWAGLGQVGGLPTRSWINGILSARVVIHELGHNFGLHHARSLHCTGGVSFGPGCQPVEYGDTVDEMGTSNGQFRTSNKARLGWLDYGASPTTATISQNGLYSLEPYETPGSGPKALKIQKGVEPDGRTMWYDLEFRQEDGTAKGIFLHLGPEGETYNTFLLTAVPGVSGNLPVGATYTDAEAGIRITPVATGATGASISVILGPASCGRMVPLVTMTPAAVPSALAGTTVDYAVRLKNRDAADCGSSTYTLEPGAPAGWPAALDSSEFTLAPGEEAATVLHVTIPANAAPAKYFVTTGAINEGEPAFSGGATASCTVVTPLKLTLAPQGATFNRGKTAKFTAMLTKGFPVQDVQIAFTFTRADGTKVTQKKKTNRSGIAQPSLKLARAAPTGTYTLRGVATFSGQTADVTIAFEVR